MKEFTCTVADPNGLHARPAGKLAAVAKQFGSRITVSANGREADCKRLLAVMGLGAVCGTELRITAEGDDEDAALEALQKHFAQASEQESAT